MADQCQHDKIMLQLWCPDCGDEIEHKELSRAEMEARAVDLPNRENMSLISANIAAPINLALAANVLSDNSSAVAIAQQYTPITQTT